MAKHRELANLVYASVLGQTSASRIWRTVVFAGAMLGTAACGGGNKGTSPTTTANPIPMTAPGGATPAATPAPSEATPAMVDPCAGKPAANPCAGIAADPCAGKTDPCAGQPQAAAAATPEPKPAPAKRPRATKNRPSGRGFILS